MDFLDNIKAVPVTDYAERCGYTLTKIGKYYSLKEHDSVRIDPDKNCFWRNSTFRKGVKGGAGSVIDFAIEINGARDAKEAIRWIAELYDIKDNGEPNVNFKKPVVQTAKKNEKKPGEVILPQKDKDNRCVYGYLLKTRCIEHSVIRYFFAKKMLYQDGHKNCVFHTGTKFACVRGTDTEKRFILDLEGCDYNECFFFRGSNEADTLVVAESVIDIMSVMSHFCHEKKKYVQYCYLALSGTNKLESVFYHVKQELEKGHPIKKVLIATDADKAGEKAATEIVDGLSSFDVECVRYAPPAGKDWNEYIVMGKGDANAQNK